MKITPGCCDYRAAQRLYIRRGYIPDGHGITYKYRPIVVGQYVPIDDDLVLWLIKDIGKKDNNAMQSAARASRR